MVIPDFTLYLILSGVLGFIFGYSSHMFLSKEGVALEKRGAVLILCIWAPFAMLGYLQQQDLSIYFNSIGLAAAFTILGIDVKDAKNIVLKRK